MFIHMFFVNVQSCSVLNACYLWIRYFVIQSCFLSTMPPFLCGYFLRDFHAFLHSHFHLCLSQHHYLIALHQPPAEMLQPGRCPSSHFTEDSGVLTSSFGLLCSPDSRTSLRLLARFTAASWLSFTIDYSTAYLRATHWPVRAIVVVNTVIILTIDLAASSGRHTRQRHMPVDRQLRHPVHHYLRRLFSPDFTERRTSKTPSTSPRRAPLHAAHAFIQLRIIACSWAPFSTASLAPSTSTSYTILHPSR